MNLSLGIKVGMASEYIDSFRPSPRWFQLVEDFAAFQTVLYDDFFPEGMELVEDFLDSKARRAAETAHRDYAGNPFYIDHLVEVVRILIGFRSPIFRLIDREHFDRVLTLGWLSGILDRTNFSRSELVREFGEDAAVAVELLSLTDEENYRGASGFKDYLRRVRSDQTAVLVLLAERIAGMRQTLRTYDHRKAYAYASQADFIVAEFRDLAPEEMLDEIEDLALDLVDCLTDQAAYNEMLLRRLIDEKFTDEAQFAQWLEENEIPEDFWDWRPGEDALR